MHGIEEGIEPTLATQGITFAFLLFLHHSSEIFDNKPNSNKQFNNVFLIHRYLLAQIAYNIAIKEYMKHAWQNE